MILRILPWLGWLAYFAGCVLILDNSIADYRPGGTGFFIAEKGEVATDPVWRFSLHLHIVAGLVCLFSALPQFSQRLLTRFPGLHRRAGRIYVLSVLVLLCPTGFHLGWHAKGGFLGKAGFLTLAVASFHTTLAAWRAVMPGQRDIRAHKAWMTRSFALAASAISFRIFHLIGYAAGLDEQTNYVGCLWLSLFANLGVAEWIIHRRLHPHPSIQLQTEP